MKVVVKEIFGRYSGTIGNSAESKEGMWLIPITGEKIKIVDNSVLWKTETQNKPGYKKCTWHSSEPLRVILPCLPCGDEWYNLD